MEDTPVKRFVLLLAIMAASAAHAHAAEPDRTTTLAQATPAPSAPPQVCTEVYQPVCGTNSSGMRVTYSNACFARAASATNVSPGECAAAK
jgi:hypothetical protein